MSCNHNASSSAYDAVLELDSFEPQMQDAVGRRGEGFLIEDAESVEKVAEDVLKRIVDSVDLVSPYQSSLASAFVDSFSEFTQVIGVEEKRGVCSNDSGADQEFIKKCQGLARCDESGAPLKHELLEKQVGLSGLRSEAANTTHSSLPDDAGLNECPEVDDDFGDFDQADYVVEKYAVNQDDLDSEKVCAHSSIVSFGNSGVKSSLAPFSDSKDEESLKKSDFGDYENCANSQFGDEIRPLTIRAFSVAIESLFFSENLHSGQQPSLCSQNTPSQQPINHCSSPRPDADTVSRADHLIGSSAVSTNNRKLLDYCETFQRSFQKVVSRCEDVDQWACVPFRYETSATRRGLLHALCVDDDAQLAANCPRFALDCLNRVLLQPLKPSTSQNDTLPPSAPVSRNGTSDAGHASGAVLGSAGGRSELPLYDSLLRSVAESESTSSLLAEEERRAELSNGAGKGIVGVNNDQIISAAAQEVLRKIPDLSFMTAEVLTFPMSSQSQVYQRPSHF